MNRRFSYNFQGGHMPFTDYHFNVLTMLKQDSPSPKEAVEAFADFLKLEEEHDAKLAAQAAAQAAAAAAAAAPTKKRRKRRSGGLSPDLGWPKGLLRATYQEWKAAKQAAGYEGVITPKACARELNLVTA